MELKYPNGDVFHVEFGEKEHTYLIKKQFPDGTWTSEWPTHGVTTPLSNTYPKHFIKPWVAKETALAAIQAMVDGEVKNPEQFLQDNFDFENKVLDPNTGKPKITYYHMRKHYPWYAEIKKAADYKGQAGRDSGDWLHKAAEEFHKSNRKTVPTKIAPEHQGMWDAFIKFDNLYKPKFDGIEFIVYSPSFGYAGMGDVRGEMMGKTVIGDYKTTNRNDSNPIGVSVDYFYQLGGLAQAEFERTGKWVDDVFIVNIDKEGGDPIVVWGSDWGMTPQELASRYLAHLVPYKCQVADDYKFKGVLRG